MDSKVEKLASGSRRRQHRLFRRGRRVNRERAYRISAAWTGSTHQQWDYPPETILSRTFFDRDPEEYYRFHHAKLVVDGAKPNRAHLRLAELEREGKLRAVVTQNIDGLPPGGGEQKRARAAREHPARLTARAAMRHTRAEAMNHCQGVAALRPLRRHRAAGHRAV